MTRNLSMTDAVTICECFARDGLQHEPGFVATDAKVAVLDAITAAGFRRIEATSYSHPDRVPAFRDASEVLARIVRRPGTAYKATCPNLRAIERAKADAAAGHGAEELSLLASVTEGHTQKNLRTTRAAQWDNIASMTAAAGQGFRLVGVLSVAFGCPIEGRVDAGAVVADAHRFAELGVGYVTIGDTTGLATPATARALFDRLLRDVPEVTPIAHFHNSRGSALANCVAALEAGCRYFDSSLGGVGGHPAQVKYGGGLTGNVATEDLVNLFESLSVPTGLDLDALMAASRLCEQVLGRDLHSMVARAGFGLLPSREPVHV